jgi:NAD(P)-dependent dehydrogenase (short-subunit alcohol dehydrogenase family)
MTTSSSARVVAVTGGARGIGAAIARVLAARGDRVAIGDLDEGEARATAATLGGDAVGLPLDVTDTPSFAAFLDAAEDAFGRPADVLVNNAGIMWVGPHEEEPERTAERQMAVNFHGVARGMRLVLPAMRARGHGHVVNVASAASRVGPAGEATYAATKHAVLGYSTAVREELRGSGVELSVVMPIVVETELAAGTAHGRTRRLKPEDVARAVAGVIDRPRFEVHVPREVAVVPRLLALLPQRGRDAVTKVLVPNQIKLTDHRARADYEAGKGLDG